MRLKHCSINAQWTVRCYTVPSELGCLALLKLRNETVLITAKYILRFDLNFYNFYPALVIRVINSMNMRLTGHTARMGVVKIAYNNTVWKSEVNRPLEISRSTWGIILKCVSKEWVVGVRNGFVWLRIGDFMNTMLGLLLP
jgi:hypothetical protein